MIQLPSSLLPIIKTLLDKGLRPVVVGGFVRDAILGLPSKDIDIELFGIKDLEALETLLAPFGKVNVVGKSFGVVKLQLDAIEVDFSIPRTEQKVAQGHKGFDVILDGSLSFKKAASRRDFTFNAMGYDLSSKELLDPFNGQKDLRERRLAFVDAETFVEDPLRLYRAVQFAARFDLQPTEALITLARKMVAEKMLEELPKERVFEEFKKLLLKSRRPSQGFRVLDIFGMLPYFPELLALQGVPQDPIYHPEGDVWIHTLMVVDVMSRLHSDDKEENLYLSLAALCHDLGKSNTTKKIDGRIRAIGHENTGVPLTEYFLERLSDEKALVEKILPLVKHHLKPMQFYKQGAKAAAIRRLANQVNISELVLLAKADYLGRTTLEARSGEFEAGVWLIQRAKELSVMQKPLPALLQGRDLVRAGLTPSKQFKVILDAAYEAQMDALFSTKEEALLWLKQYINEVY